MAVTTREPVLVQPSLHHILFACDRARQDEIAQYEALVGPWEPSEVAARYFQRPGVKFVLLGADRLPAACGGWCPVIPGVWQSWMIGTDHGWQDYGRVLSRHCRRIMDRLLDSGARRLELAVLASRADACRWYEKALHMRAEGVHVGYGMGGEDVVTYARVRES